MTQMRLMHLALMHVYNDVLDSLDIGRLINAKLHQLQPGKEGNIWSCVTPISHFL